ncbi:unnamed protein product [Rotaria sordida]|nr:unnamed protein product [Rotaria sordida]CAF1230479.1 unnamed protein product [Rotaria sordida]CAF1230753.1 unnamed protein product [Rotaria sordida]CAF1387775.1 unnamed protein product [Rotaria sordida]CAF1512472.1 unnamed protein product [Rotaria sordida]
MNTDLTHPEILTIEQLQNHLIKFVGSDITNDKYELIQLFYKYIAPLPQRKFRTNRLGTMLTNSQTQFKGKKRLISTDLEDIEKSYESKLKLSAKGLHIQSQGEKHESDRGIYTIKMQKTANKNTAPIKLKRPAATTTINNDQETNKRMKLDETHV